MPDKIYFRRGNVADLPTLAQGEPGFALDTKKLYVGTATGNAQVAMATIEAVIAPTLLNGWVNFGAGFQTAGYYKDNFGIVHLTGAIKSGTATITTALFTLPVGYRPIMAVSFTTYSNDGLSTGTLQITVNGNVNIITGSNANLFFDGISFRAT